MGVLADFYVSDPGNAVEYDVEPSAFDSHRAQYKMFTPLELFTLWAFLKDVEWEVSMMDFDCVLVEDDGERLIHEMSSDLVSDLANIDTTRIDEVSTRWGATEELQLDTSDVVPVVNDLIRLAQHAQQTGQSMYIWNCV